MNRYYNDAQTYAADMHIISLYFMQTIDGLSIDGCKYASFHYSTHGITMLSQSWLSLTHTHRHITWYYRETVDSLCRDGTDAPIM